jgi:hypothetical protein
MPDLTAGTTVLALDTPPTVSDAQPDSYTFTNTTFGVGTTGGTYADCGVAFVAPTTGRVLVYYDAELSNSSAAPTGSFIAPVVRTGGTVGSGTTVHAASSDEVVAVRGTSAKRAGAHLFVEGLTAGDTYNVRLEHSVNTGTGTALRRSVTVAPAT